jgi:hypothetical protein
MQPLGWKYNRKKKEFTKPTPEEIEAMMSNPEPDKYNVLEEKLDNLTELVSQLLKKKEK